MKAFATLALAGAASATLMDTTDFEFMKFISKWGKRYATTEEFEFRLSLFKKAHEEIEAHNATNPTSTMGHNNFSDWSDEEF